MKLKYWLLKKIIDSLTYDEQRYVISELPFYVHDNIIRKHSKQKELKDNGVQRAISNSTTKRKVSIVAYASKLGTEIPAYRLRTDKETDTTAPIKHKNVGQNKKKIRPVK